ncbi:hypothetical protein BJY00DRAFT_17930 [Aspergillus carlsbadensis]|nr:hypothetical protein BJY00DRAFT_17930 [Aspergillus carlsbadensis]
MIIHRNLRREMRRGDSGSSSDAGVGSYAYPTSALHKTVSSAWTWRFRCQEWRGLSSSCSAARRHGQFDRSTRSTRIGCIPAYFVGESLERYWRAATVWGRNDPTRGNGKLCQMQPLDSTPFLKLPTLSSLPFATDRRSADQDDLDRRLACHCELLQNLDSWRPLRSTWSV